MKNKLLEKALNHKVRRKVSGISTKDEIEVAFEWMKGNLNLGQICVAFDMNIKTGNILYRVASILRSAYEQGYLEIKDEKNSTTKKV